MAVVTVTGLTVKPDRYKAFLEDVRTAKGLIEKAGGKNVRLLAAMMAGEQTGSFALVSEEDNWTAHGKGLDAFYGDPEAQELLMTTNSSEGSGNIVQMSTWMDVPL